MNHSLNGTLRVINQVNVRNLGRNLTGPIYHGGIATLVCFAIVAILSIFGNGCIFILLIYSRKLRNSSHGVLIWNLALVDFLTGIFVIITPEHIIREAYIHPPPGLGGQIFCKIIGSEIFTFCFGFTSMYTLVALAVERRFAVVRSSLHSRYFTIVRTRIMLIFIWMWGLLLVMVNLWQVRYEEDKNPPCQWSSLPGAIFHMVFYLVLFCLRFLLPITIIVFCYINIWHFMNTTIDNFSSSMNRQNTATYKMKTKVTITCAVTSLAFFVCWLPNQIYFTLANLNLLKIDNDFHFITKLLVLFNSAINPFIYGITNPYYRQEFASMMGRIRLCRRPKLLRVQNVNFDVPKTKNVNSIQTKS